MAEIARELGVPANDLLVEDRSTNTFENVAFSRALLDRCGLLDRLAVVILVSSEWHMRRVLLTAQAGFPRSVRFVCCPTCEGCDRPNWTESEAIRDRMTEKPTAFFDQYVDPQYDIWKGGRSKARRFTDRR